MNFAEESNNNNENLLDISGQRRASEGDAEQQQAAALDTETGEVANETISSNGVEEGLVCSICLLPFEMTGSHRTVSLACGHLFGDLCIRRWLTTHTTCPNCNALAEEQDVRIIYAARVRAIDMAEELGDLRTQLEVEHHARVKAQNEVKWLKIDLLLKAKRIEAREREFARMKNWFFETPQTIGEATDETTQTSSSNDEATGGTENDELTILHAIDMAQKPGSIIMQYATRSRYVFYERLIKMPTFNNYGLQFIDYVTNSTKQFLHCSVKPLHDVSIFSNERTLAVISGEQHAKLYDVRSNRFVQEYRIEDGPGIACDMRRNYRDNELLIATIENTIGVYDVRQLAAPIQTYEINDYNFRQTVNRIIKIVSIKRGVIFPHGGFLVCTFRSLYFYEYSANDDPAIPTRLYVEGPFYGMRYSVESSVILLSCHDRCIVGTLTRVEGTIVFDMRNVVDTRGFSSLVTPALGVHGQDALIAGYISERTKMLAVYDADSRNRVVEYPVEDPIESLCPLFSSEVCIFFGMLNSKKTFTQFAVGLTRDGGVRNDFIGDFDFESAFAEFWDNYFS